MKPAVATLVFLLAALWANAQTATLRPEVNPPEDPKLRAEAVRLLEQANHVSTPAVWPPNQVTLLFRVGTPAPGDPVEGEYVSSVGGPGVRRIECQYGDYQFTHIKNGQRVSLVEPKVSQPGVLNLLNELAPIYLVRFDNQDVIRSITEPSPGTRCIQFDTVTGDRQQANEICVDARNGWLLSVRTGDTITRNSDFFGFQGAFLPHRVERSTGGQKVLEIDVAIVPKDDYPPDFFQVPEDTKAYLCQDLRRAYAVNTPQPEPRTASLDVIDVKLLGYIDKEGRVFGLRPIGQVRPGLNEEAMKLVSTWTYTPATCGGKVAMVANTFTVQFKGW